MKKFILAAMIVVAVAVTGCGPGPFDASGVRFTCKDGGVYRSSPLGGDIFVASSAFQAKFEGGVLIRDEWRLDDYFDWVDACLGSGF